MDKVELMAFLAQDWYDEYGGCLCSVLIMFIVILLNQPTLDQ
jgi:hypothetical protein